MTIEEKAKAYDEALEKAKELLDSPRTCFDIVQLKDIFPELRESEDEKVINLIRSLLETARNAQSNTALYKEYDDALAWLEKQKEPKKEFHIPDYMGMAHYNPAPIEQKEQKLTATINGEPIPTENQSVNIPLVEWSEEDENKLNHILEIVHIASAREASVDEKEELESFLKSLRPSWKPSEEQMEALLNILHPDDPYYNELKSLYEQLKKL